MPRIGKTANNSVQVKSITDVIKVAGDEVGDLIGDEGSKNDGFGLSLEDSSCQCRNISCGGAGWHLSVGKNHQGERTGMGEAEG